MFKRSVKKILAETEIVNPFRKMFTEIEIETTAYCNRKCTYCPVSMYPRPGDEDDRYMREEVFDKILDDLAKLNFEGMIAPHMYGEPLTDPRIVEWSRKIKTKLPKAKLKIVTNGDYMTEELYYQLLDAGVDFFNISKHSKTLGKKITALLDKLPEEEKNERFNILDFWADFGGDQEMFNTRAGEVELKVKKVHPIMCSYVTYPVINTFGEIVLCCNDYHSEYKFGNVMDRTLDEIWFDPKNVAIRKRIFKGHMDNEACKNCYM